MCDVRFAASAPFIVLSELPALPARAAWRGAGILSLARRCGVGRAKHHKELGTGAQGSCLLAACWACHDGGPTLGGLQTPACLGALGTQGIEPGQKRIPGGALS
jgi:hypothetical protein